MGGGRTKSGRRERKSVSRREWKGERSEKNEVRRIKEGVG